MNGEHIASIFLKEMVKMHYVLLIYGSEAEYNQMTEAQRAEILHGHYAFNEEVQRRGIVVGGQALQPPSVATTVRVRNGKLLTTDGPFAETIEQLGGTYVLDCKDLDEAIELAAKLPEAAFGSIEIRPVMMIPPL
jgi:hypothetical protein